MTIPTIKRPTFFDTFGSEVTLKLFDVCPEGANSDYGNRSAAIASMTR